jgi:antitoxin CptB
MTHNLETRRKRLRYRTGHTGIKETDLLLGGFAASHLAALTAEQVGQFEALLDAACHDILDWVTGRVPVPAAYDNELMVLLMHYVEGRRAP